MHARCVGSSTPSQILIPVTQEAFTRLFHDLFQPAALIELGALVSCLGAACLVVHLLRRVVRRPSTIWFGDRFMDGLLFPCLALLFAVIGRVLLMQYLPIAVFRVVVPLLIALVVIRFVARALQAAFPESPLTLAVERTFSWMAWVGAALWITGVLPTVLGYLDGVQWKIGSAQVSVTNLIQGVITAAVVMMIALWASAALEARLLKGAKGHLSMRKMAANTLRALLLFVGVMFALSAAGIDPTALGVLGGAIGVGIGFGLQRLAANYISGFVILAEGSSRIGNLVKVDGFEGRIANINSRYTVIRAADGRESIVPNEMMVIQRVENATFATAPTIAKNTVLRVSHNVDFDALMPKLVVATSKVTGALESPAPSAELSSIAADWLEITVVFWIDDPALGGKVSSDVNRALLHALEAEGVALWSPTVGATPTTRPPRAARGH
jgi:small-conductance mechanosensitive channel